MSDTQQAVTAQVKPFSCHGEPYPGKPCMARLTLAEAWVPKLSRIKKAIGRRPSAVKDLSDHTFCGRCMAMARRAGRKEGLRFYRLPQTVVEMERQRAERTQQALKPFRRYL